MKAIPSSKIVMMYPLVTALVKAEAFLGAQRFWQGINSQQMRFLTEIFVMCRAEGETISEIESIASPNIDEVNRFLFQHGFIIQLNPPSPPGFAIASIVELFIEWVERGSETQIRDHMNTWYPAVQLVEGVTYYRSNNHHHPIAKLATKAGDEIYMTALDQVLNEFDLLTRVEQCIRSSHLVDEFAGVIFPMVDVRQQVDVSWLVGMRTMTTNGLAVFIAQALQQTIFQMNEAGVRAKSAFTAEFLVGSAPPATSKPNMIIDRPFLIWWMRQGLSKPLFVGYITQENWKKP
jgi:hypothetical protein